MPDEFQEAVTISSTESFKGKKKIDPSNLSKIAPHGTGVYGLQRPQINPFVSAPPHEGNGGIVYFGSSVIKNDFLALLRILGVSNRNKQFAVFLKDSSSPGKDGYIRQVRIIPNFGLRYLFGAIKSHEYDSFPKQLLSTREVLWKFIESEENRWGTHFWEDKGLSGMFGGDGHYACEELSFGFMIENDYHRVYRIWSRAWLVTR